jgi:hypothetical protein
MTRDETKANEEANRKERREGHAVPEALGLTDSAEGPIRCGTFSEKAEAETKTQDGANYNASMRKQVRDLRQKLDETEKSLAESRKHCIAWAEQVSRAEGDRDIAPALAALNALHRVDIVNLLAQYDAVIEGRADEEIYTPDAPDAAVVEDIRLRWLGPEPGDEAVSYPQEKREDSEKPSCQPEPDITPNTLSLQQKELGAILDAKTREIEAAGLCDWGYCTGPTDSLRIAAEVRERRAEQDKQWGGPKHDDEHFPADWVRYIRKAARQAMTREAPQEAEGFEDYMLDVAALAVAAIESSRRKRAMAGDAWGGE